MKKLFFNRNNRVLGLIYIFNLVISTFLIFFVFYFLVFKLEGKIGRKLNFSFMIPAFPILLKGFSMSLLLSFSSLFLSLILGAVLYYLNSCDLIFARIVSRVYISLVRGTPLIVQVFLLYYGVFSLFVIKSDFVIGLLIISMFSSAYVAEIIRSGVSSVGKGQFEATKSLGLNNLQAYFYVIIPQSIKIMLPSLTGQLVSIIKDTSILSVISIREFTMVSREISSSYFLTFEVYIPLAIAYLFLTLPISFLSKLLENNLSRT